MAVIKNIIFDLGGVLLNIDFNRTGEAFKKLGVKGFDELYSKEAANELFEKLEMGLISNDVFYERVLQYCKPGTSVQEVQQAWNAILVGFRTESVAFLSGLKSRYNLYLLSNTNLVHHVEFSRMYQQQLGGTLDANFSKAYYSHEMHRRKPYAETYRYVLQQEALSGEETLFIDDAVVNIEGAVEAGLQTHLLLPEERVEALGL